MATVPPPILAVAFSVGVFEFGEEGEYFFAYEGAKVVEFKGGVGICAVVAEVCA